MDGILMAKGGTRGLVMDESMLYPRTPVKAGDVVKMYPPCVDNCIEFVVPADGYTIEFSGKIIAYERDDTPHTTELPYSKVSAKEGDVIVVSYAGKLSKNQIETILSSLMLVFESNKVMILEEGMTLGVVSQDKAVNTDKLDKVVSQIRGAWL